MSEIFNVDWECDDINNRPWVRYATRDRNGEIWIWDHKPITVGDRWMPVNGVGFSKWHRIKQVQTDKIENHETWKSDILEFGKVNSKSHLHAGNMMEYAKDALKTKTPWKFWEFNDGNGWTQCVCDPMWNENVKYRRISETISFCVKLNRELAVKLLENSNNFHIIDMEEIRKAFLSAERI